MNELHTVAFSGGLGSGFVLAVLCEKLNLRPVLLHTDTKYETDDTYEFMESVANYYDLEVEYVADGRTPEQLFWDEHLLGNDIFPVCSHKLKADQCDAWILRKQIEKFFPVMYLGIMPDEPKRMERLRNRYNHMGAGPEIPVHFPLSDPERPERTSREAGELLSEAIGWRSSVSNQTMAMWFNKRGIETPEAYKLGFSHNNCKGECVRAGLGHWYQMYMKKQEGFQRAAMREYRFATEVYPLTKKGNGHPALDSRGFPTVTFLKRKGRPLSLLEMEQMIKHGWSPGDRSGRDNLPCMCEV